MKQDPKVDNDLQKAIDDITNTTEIDPVFDDAVATPVGDTADEPAKISVEEEKTIIEDTPMAKTEEVPFAEETSVKESIINNANRGGSNPPANVQDIKEAALRDLTPLLEKVDLTPAQRFGFYRNAIDRFGDFGVIEAAYHTATGIQDDRERGEALLYLVDLIDRM